MGAISKPRLKERDEIKGNLKDNLLVLRLIYVVSYTLGYSQITTIFPHHLSDVSRPEGALIMFAAAVLFLLSVRFYWAVGNIKRYLFEKVDKARGDSKSELMKALKWPFRYTMIFHVHVLMAHSFTFFLLARYLVDIAKQFQNDTVEVGEAVGHAPVKTFVAIYCGLLLLNSAWVRLLKTKGEKEAPEWFWMWNNAAIAAVGGIWVLAGFYFGIGDQLIFAIALVLFLVNSVFDFWHCYPAYISQSAG